MPFLDATHLPFNRESLEGRFLVAHHHRLDIPAGQPGVCLLIQDQSLVLAESDGTVGTLLRWPLPDGLQDAASDHLLLGTYLGEPCWAASVRPDLPLPAGVRTETVIPARTKLKDDVLSLGGLALQAMGWEASSRFCPRCGAPAARIPGELGKRCSACAYDHYPHLHPAIIVLVRDTDRVLLTRKSFWPKGRYGLVAGFVDVGESLEAATHREVQEEVGVSVRDIRYIASQYWPFPSQLMIGFTAAYAGGDLQVDTAELEDARWFSVRELPDLPPPYSIARYILDRYARP